MGRRMSGEDVALFLADPEFAQSLGIEAPTCARCGGAIKVPPLNWDGTTQLVHLIPVACEWEVARRTPDTPEEEDHGE